jgi:hypothetical protein
MTDRNTQIRTALAAGPVFAGSLRTALGVARPTLARALAEMPGEIVALGAARATQYALRDSFRGLADMPVYRVNATGQIKHLGQLCPVRPDGFVVLRIDGKTDYYEGLPWWLADMRPQGFLGRAYAHQHASGLGLPPDVRHWSDTDALRALLASGGDAVGNLLLGDLARERFVNALAPVAVGANAYPRLAAQALTQGDTWSSAGGEQPKFCAYTGRGHVLVKFTVADDNAIAARTRDLLLAEHLALETLAARGAAAAVSHVVDIKVNVGVDVVGVQRFLELERFDRAGTHGRQALFSLACLDGEFVGNATAPWPVVTRELAKQKLITERAHAGATLLYAFGTLIANTDMHAGNLSFVGGDQGGPFELSPAYDMLPMAFSPSAGGVMRDTLSAAHLHASVDGETWRAALGLAKKYLVRLSTETRWSAGFQPCINALHGHVENASQKIDRLG